MLDQLGEITRATGSRSEGANATGSALARLSELLTNRLTAAKAAFLDAALSTRILASAFTSARAAKIDLVGIKSIQRGTITTAAGTGTATITSVNTAKAWVYLLGFTTAVNATGLARVTLTNGTTVTGDYSGGAVATIGYCVVENN